MSPTTTLITSTMVIAATARLAASADGSWQIVADARLVLAGGGVFIGWALRATGIGSAGRALFRARLRGLIQG